MGQTYHSRPRLPVVLKGIDRRAMTAQAVLTVPAVDYAGDLVDPAGGVWDARPYVNVEHRETIGDGVVEMKSLGGVLVPVGTTHFRRGDKLAEQTFRLVADDVMTGVSLEFTAIRAKSMGHRSPLEPRDAMHFVRWRGLGWAHCVQPVNPDARTLAVEKAIRVAELGRIGSEALHPVLLKSLSQYVRPRPALARVPAQPPGAAMPKPQTKAMDDDDIYTPPSDEPPPPPLEDELPPDDTEAGTPEVTESESTPTAQASYDLSQGILDIVKGARDELASHVEAMLSKGEHVKGKAKLRKVMDDFDGLLEDLEACAADANAVGEMVDADAADEPAESEPAEGDVGPDDDDEDEDEDDLSPKRPETTEKGLLVVKSGYKPRRFVLVGDALHPAGGPEDLLAAEKKALDAITRQLRQNARFLRQTRRRNA